MVGPVIAVGDGPATVVVARGLATAVAVMVAAGGLVMAVEAMVVGG
jgi:hypothetical protein